MVLHLRTERVVGVLVLVLVDRRVMVVVELVVLVMHLVLRLHGDDVVRVGGNDRAGLHVVHRRAGVRGDGSDDDGLLLHLRVVVVVDELVRVVERRRRHSGGGAAAATTERLGLRTAEHRVARSGGGGGGGGSGRGADGGRRARGSGAGHERLGVDVLTSRLSHRFVLVFFSVCVNGI